MMLYRYALEGLTALLDKLDVESGGLITNRVRAAAALEFVGTMVGRLFRDDTGEESLNTMRTSLHEQPGPVVRVTDLPFASERAMNRREERIKVYADRKRTKLVWALLCSCGKYHRTDEPASALKSTKRTDPEETP